MNRRAPRRPRGFTLIELTVVTAVLVIATGFVIVRVSGWSSRQSLRSSALGLGNTIRLWRERARDDEKTYTIAFDERSYRVLSGKELLRSGRLSGGQVFERDTPAAIAFTPRGIVTGARLTLRNESGERMTLVLGPLLNEIDYEEPR